MEFLNEENFDRETYDMWLRRIHYDDRDATMYEHLLEFLWSYVIDVGSLDDREGLLEEYTHWNMQMIDKCLYHLPQDQPYVHIRRAYQSIVHLLDGDLEAGMQQLALMGETAFVSDGKAPKLFLSGKGERYAPMSRLFLLYNYAKVLGRIDEEMAHNFQGKYPYAFTVFRDGQHEEHDSFYEEQMQVQTDVIFYPVFERVYKLPWGPKEFYVYYDISKGIPIDRLPVQIGDV